MCRIVPWSVCSATATASGIECVTRTNSALERADLHRLAVRVDLDQLRVVAHAVLVELRLDQAERQPRAPDLGHADLAHQVRQRADVVLVAVREDDRPQRARRVAQVAEVGQHEVDAEHLVAREAEARIDQDPLAVLLDHGHVLADLAETAERDDPNGRRHRVAVAPASAVRPNAASAAWIATRSAAVASISGRRSPPTRCPSRASAVLIGIGLTVTERASSSGASSAFRAWASSSLPAATRSQSSMKRAADEMRRDADAAAAAELEERQHEVVVARVERDPDLDDRACLRRCPASTA